MLGADKGVLTGTSTIIINRLLETPGNTGIRILPTSPGEHIFIGYVASRF